LGARLNSFANHRERLTNRNMFLIERQIKRLAELDPYWNYPRDMMGNKIDPATGKRIEQKSVDENGVPLRKSAVFDFDKFYSYMCLYKAKYNSLNIHCKTVVVIRDGKPAFVRRELAKINGEQIEMHLGRFLKEVIYFYKDPAKGMGSIKLLTNPQYAKLAELDPMWYATKKEKLGVDYVSQEWSQYCIEHSLKAPRVRKTKKASEKPKKLDEEQKTEAEDNENSTKAQTTKEIKNFYFDLFFEICKRQKEITGHLDFSKAHVVTLNEGTEHEKEYPIGMLFHTAAATLRFEEDTKAGKEVTPLEKSLPLTDEQKALMAGLEWYWYKTYKEKSNIRVEEVGAKREAWRRKRAEQKQLEAKMQ